VHASRVPQLPLAFRIPCYTNPRSALVYLHTIVSPMLLPSGAARPVHRERFYSGVCAPCALPQGEEGREREGGFGTLQSRRAHRRARPAWVLAEPWAVRVAGLSRPPRAAT